MARLALSSSSRARKQEEAAHELVHHCLIPTCERCHWSLCQLLGVGGFEMALSTWGLSTPWVAVSLVSVVLIGPIGAFVLDPKMRLIAASARAIPDGTLPQTLFRRTHDPILEIAANTLTSLLLGIVFLMTTKPQLLPSLLVMGIAFLLGIFVSLLRWLVERDARYPPDYLNDGEEADPFMRKTFWTRQW